MTTYQFVFGIPLSHTNVRINLKLEQRDDIIKDIVLARSESFFAGEKAEGLPDQKQTGNFLSASHHHKQSSVLSLVPVQVLPIQTIITLMIH